MGELSRNCFLLSITLILFSTDQTAAQATFTTTGSPANANWTTASAWSCGGCGRNYPGETGVSDDIVIINHQINFNSFSAPASLTVGSVTITNNSAIEARLSVAGNGSNSLGRVLTVNSGISITGSAGQSAILRIRDNAQVTVNSSILLLRNSSQAASFSAILDVNDFGSLTVNGNVNYVYQGSTDENSSELSFGSAGDSSPTILITGDLYARIQSTAISFLNVMARNNTQLTVNGNIDLTSITGGTDQNVNFFLSNDPSTDIPSDHSASEDPASSIVTVGGNMTLTVNADPNGPDVRLAIRGSSQLNILGDLILEHWSNYNDNDISIRLVDSGQLNIGGDLTMSSHLGTNSRDNYFDTYENSLISVLGNISMDAVDANDNANVIRMSDNSILQMGGNLIRAVDEGANNDGYIEFYDNSTLNLFGTVQQTLFKAPVNAWSSAFPYYQGDWVVRSGVIYEKLNDANNSSPSYTTTPPSTDWAIVSQPSAITTIVGNNVYRNVQIDNPGTETTKNTLIYGNLNMINGVLESTPAAEIIFPSSTSTVSGGSYSSYITGPIRKINSGDMVIPLGDGTRWAPLELSNISFSGAVPEYDIQYFASPYSSFTTDGTIDHVSWAEYWNFNSMGNSSTLNLALHWKDACWSEILDLGPPQDLFIGLKDNTTGALWTKLDAPTVTSTSTSGSACDFVLPNTESGNVSVTGLSMLSHQYLLTFSAVDMFSNPLPVTLGDFIVKSEKDHVSVTWTTYAQLNTDRFEIERHDSKDHQFDWIGSVIGAGTTTELMEYKFEDRQPLFGKSYYRLKSVDLDGNFNYSDVVSVNRIYDKNEFVTVYYDGSVNFRISMEEEGEVSINIYDMKGNIIESQVSHLKAGINTIEMSSLEAELNSGICVAHIYAPGKFVVKKLF